MKHPVWIAISLLVTLPACGPSSNSGGAASTATHDITISGAVLTDDGPLKSARILAKSLAGSVVADGELSADSRFSIKIPKATPYPLVLTASPGGEEPDMRAALLNDKVTEQDISPVTTIVVDTALSLGGLTEANLTKASGAAIAQRRKSGGSGTSAGFSGDPTKQYGGWH